MQITLERQSKTIALSFNTDNSIAYDELYLAVQDKMSAIVNGGKFFVGKAFTIVGNAVSVLSKNIYVQGLTVAAAGGLGSRLAGGSFELGFLTAGLAFAVNQVVTQLAQEGQGDQRSFFDRLVDGFKDRVSVSSKFRAGVGPAIDVGPTVNNRELAETGSVRVDPGGGEGLGASGSLTVDVMLFEAGPVVNSPVLTNHTFCAGAGVGGCVNATFLDGRVFSLTVSGGIVGGVSFTNTVAAPIRVRVFPDP